MATAAAAATATLVYTLSMRVHENKATIFFFLLCPFFVNHTTGRERSHAGGAIFVVVVVVVVAYAAAVVFSGHKTADANERRLVTRVRDARARSPQRPPPPRRLAHLFVGAPCRGGGRRVVRVVRMTSSRLIILCVAVNARARANEKRAPAVAAEKTRKTKMKKK